MENGELKMENLFNGKWRIENGKCWGNVQFQFSTFNFKF